MRKAIQIISGDREYNILVVLCDDGTIWRRVFDKHPNGYHTWIWKQIENIPQG